MPANLSPEYLDAEQRYKEARTDTEKLAALEEMLSTIPKHKGTEKMQAEIKRKISRLRSGERKKGATRKAPPVHLVEREGAGQVALVGPPNSGKSSLVRRLTHATPEVADYPFTTRLPVPGMMPFENIQIQLVDLPPLHPDSPETWVTQTVRSADAMILVVDLGSAAVLEELTETMALLEQAKLIVGPPSAELPRGFAHKPALLVGNKSDRPSARENFQILGELWKDRFRLLALSVHSGENLDVFPRAVFELLGIVRVYTKVPGKKADFDAPYVLPRGATVSQVASRVHKDFVARLKFARVWGGGRFDGQMVQRDYIVEDNDVLELHL